MSQAMSCVQVLGAYDSVQDSANSSATEAFEHSEMLLYQAQLLQQAGKRQEALAHLAAKQVHLNGRCLWYSSGAHCA